jgi:PAS domain S-box-containing protein
MEKRQPWRILIIDDDEDDYLLVRSMISNIQVREIHLEWAPNYESGHKRLCTDVYDAVLVDYDLGEQTGIDLIRQTVAADYPAPFILFTGRGSTDVDSEALKAGATFYLTKNEVNPLLLERSIRYAIERKQLEAELEHERALLESVIQQLPTGVIIAEAPSGRVIRGNETIRELLGDSFINSKDIGDYSRYQGFHPDGSPYLPEEWPMARSILKGEVVNGEEIVIQLDGDTRRFFSLNSAPIYRNDQIIAGVVVINDITQRRLMEHELRQSEERFRTSVENMVDGLAILSSVREETGEEGTGKIVDFRFEYVNQAGCQLNRRTKEDHIGRTLLEILPNHKETGHINQYIRVVETGQPLILEDLEYEDIYGDGEKLRRVFDTRLAKLGDGCVVTWREVTKYRDALKNQAQIRATLQETERRLQLAHAAAHLGSWKWTAGDSYVVASDTFFHLHGLQPAPDGRLELEDYFSLIHPSDRRRVIAYTTRAIGGEPYEDIADKEFRILLPDGSQRWMAAYQKPIRDGETLQAITGVTMDISELVLAEQAARRGEEYMRQVLNSMFSFVGVLTLDGVLLEANRAALEAAGIQFSDVFNKPFEDTYWWNYSPSVQAQLRDAIRRAAEGESVRFDVTIRVAGERKMTIDFMLAPMRDEEGNIHYLIPSGVDITNRKLAEEALQEYARQLERSNQDLEEFAFVASHDLQEPLRKVRAFSEFILNESEKTIGEKERDYLERIHNAAVRMSKMLTDLLAYSRVVTQVEEAEEVDLRQVAEEVVSDLEVSLARSHGKIEIGELPVIHASPTQMRQLLQNLISNSLKFHKPGEPPRVYLRASSLHEDQVLIEVEDNGIGFDPENAASLFQPFQRLVDRKEYEGSGIGLATCRKIVERHGGEISADSVSGQGAVFRIKLPRRK